MVTAVGSTAKLAIAKGATWLTLPALGATSRMHFNSTNLDYNQDDIEDDKITGRSTRGAPEQGNARNTGNIILTSDYRQVPNMLLAALMMGSSPAPTIVDTDARLHVMKYQPSVAGLFFGAGVDYGQADVRGYKSLKVSRHLTAIAVGGRVDETFDCVGGGLDKTISSGTWDYTQDPTDGNSKTMLGRQMAVRVNTASGAALGSGDVIYPTRVEIDCNRNLLLQFAQGADPTEPVPNGWDTVTVRMTFAGADAALIALFKDAKEAKTRLKADVVLDDGEVVGAVSATRHRAWYFPKLAVGPAPLAIPGPGPVPFQVTMTAHQAAAAPTGFPAGYVDEVTQEWQNEVTDTILA